MRIGSQKNVFIQHKEAIYFNALFHFIHTKVNLLNLATKFTKKKKKMILYMDFKNPKKKKKNLNWQIGNFRTNACMHKILILHKNNIGHGRISTQDSQKYHAGRHGFSFISCRSQHLDAPRFKKVPTEEKRTSFRKFNNLR